jgi:hypothetical protein
MDVRVAVASGRDVRKPGVAESIEEAISIAFFEVEEVKYSADTGAMAGIGARGVKSRELQQSWVPVPHALNQHLA